MRAARTWWQLSTLEQDRPYLGCLCDPLLNQLHHMRLDLGHVNLLPEGDGLEARQGLAACDEEALLCGGVGDTALSEERWEVWRERSAVSGEDCVHERQRGAALSRPRGAGLSRPRGAALQQTEMCRS